MFGKLALGGGGGGGNHHLGPRANKQYRYSRELREETRRGSRIYGPGAEGRQGEPASVSAQSLMSLVDAESATAVRPLSLLAGDGATNDISGRQAARQRPPLYDASGIDVRPLYELETEAKRKISDHQVRCLVQTR